MKSFVKSVASRKVTLSRIKLDFEINNLNLMNLRDKYIYFHLHATDK